MAFKAIPVTAAQVSGSHSNFPVYIKPSAMTGWGSLTSAEADSIRFYSDEAKTTELAREVVSADEIHVKVSTFDDSTTIYADYDGVRSDYAVTATYGRNAVWGDYEFVSHDGGLTDSAGNVSPTNSGTVSATGKLGTGADFVASQGDWINLGSSLSIAASTDRTLSYWFKKTSTDAANNFVFDTQSGRFIISAAEQVTGLHRIGLFDGAWKNYGSNNFTNGLWEQAHHVFSGTSAILYLDSTNSGSVSYTQTAIGGTSVLGSRYFSQPNNQLDGALDEFRLRASALSATWITTEYNNQNDVASFWGTVTDAGGVVVVPTGFFAFV